VRPAFPVVPVPTALYPILSSWDRALASLLLHL
jgi:hypothetical protein